MLERLDTIDWGSLTHAYGEATDVPGLIRSLLSPDAEERERALEAELEREAAEISSVRQAVSSRLSLLLQYLRDPERDIRWLLAIALRNYFEHSAESLPALHAAAAAEADEKVREAMRESVQQLTNPAPDLDRQPAS